MYCPRCNQGEVAAAKVIQNETFIWLCEECEAIWFSEKDVGEKPFLDFGTYMESVGLKPLWEEIVILESSEKEL